MDSIVSAAKLQAQSSPLDTPIAVTFFPDQSAQSKREETLTLRQLKTRIEAARAPSKAQLEWLKLATFNDQRSPKGSLRHNANIARVTGIEIDCDDNETQPMEAVRRLQAAGVAALVYTSPSHSLFKPRWRVLAPLAAPVGMDQRKRLAGVLNAILDGVAARESFTASQSYYYGEVDGADDHHVTLTDGTPLDYVTDIDPVFPAYSESKPIEIPARAPGSDGAAYARQVLDAAVRVFYEAEASGATHPTINRVAKAVASFVRGGWIEAETVCDVIREHMPRPANGGEVESAVDWAVDRAEPWTGGEEFEALPPLPEPPAAVSRKLFTSRDFRVDPNETYIIKHMLAPRNVCVLLGHPGAGKSTLAPYLAFAVAQGRTVFGMRTKPGRTLYIAAEDVRGVEKRIGALGRRYGDTDDCAVIGCGNLRDPAAQAEVFATVAEFKPALVVLDTLAAAFAGLDENASQDMGGVVAFGRKLADSGAAVMFVHHPAKNGDGTPRGYGVLNGTLELTITLAPDDVHDPNTIVRGKLPKNKNGTTARDLAFRKEVIELGRDADGEPITTTLPVEVDADTAKAAKPVKQSVAEVKALAALQDMLDGPDTRDHEG